MKKLTVLFLGLFVAAGAFAQTNWALDRTHSSFTFTVTHMTIAETSGTFKGYDVKVTSPSDDFNGADVEFSAKIDSIDTDNARRDGHLKSPDFFDAAKHPDLKFAGKLVKDGGKYHLKGKLTMKDVTKDVDFDVVYKGTLKTAQFTKAGFKISGKVNRFDYNLKWDRTVEAGGGLVVGQEVDITANIELNMAKPK